MAQSRSLQLLLIRSALEMMPTPIRESLIDNQAFREKFDLSTSARITLRIG